MHPPVHIRLDLILCSFTINTIRQQDGLAFVRPDVVQYFLSPKDTGVDIRKGTQVVPRGLTRNQLGAARRAWGSNPTLSAIHNIRNGSVGDTFFMLTFAGPFPIVVGLVSGKDEPAFQFDLLRILDSHDVIVLTGLDINTIIGDFIPWIEFRAFAHMVLLPYIPVIPNVRCTPFIMNGSDPDDSKQEK